MNLKINMIDNKIVGKHLDSVLEEKTKQYADHLINKATLERKIKGHAVFKDEEKFEKDLKFMAGKKELKNQKYMSEFGEEYKKNLTEYVKQKNDISNLEYSEKALIEHLEFLEVVKSLRDSLK